MQISTVVSSLVGACLLIAWRAREGRRPASVARMVVPLYVMTAVGAGLMFTDAPIARLAVALLAGSVLGAYPLILTTELTKSVDGIRVRASKAFGVVVLALAAARLALRAWAERSVTPAQATALLLALAIGAFLPWRLSLYLRYRALASEDTRRPVAAAAAERGRA